MKLVALMSLFAVTFLNALAPGPGVLFVCNTAVRSGWRPVVLCLTGMLLGTTLLFLLSIFSILGLIKITPSLFEVVRWSGVAILLCLAFALWPRGGEGTNTNTIGSPKTPYAFLTGLTLSLCQPMSLLFMLAVIPQFVIETSVETAIMMTVLITVLLGTGLAMTTAAVFATQLRICFQRWQNHFEKSISLCFAVFAAILAANEIDV